MDNTTEATEDTSSPSPRGDFPKRIKRQTVQDDLDSPVIPDKEYVPAANLPVKTFPVEANHYPMIVQESSTIFMYSVEFQPEVDSGSIGLKRALVNQHKEELGVFLFDGTKLFSRNDTGDRNFLSKDRAEASYQIFLRKTNEIPGVSVAPLKETRDRLHLYNILFNKVLGKMELKRMGRNFFDPKSATKFPNESAVPPTARLTDLNQFSDSLNSQPILRKKTQDKDWQHVFRNANLNDAQKLSKWILLYSGYAGRNEQILKDFVSSLQKVAGGVSFQIDQPKVVYLENDSADSHQRWFNDNKSLLEGAQFLLCVLPNDNKIRYNTVKLALCRDSPVPSQCVLLKTASSNQKLILSVCTKIALQMHCKLGGDLWHMNIPLGKTMIIGIDVTHDGARKGQSVAAFCATENVHFTQYFSRTVTQQPGQELFDSLGMLTEFALKRYFQVNNFPPRAIIVYRDGVGDGQLESVRKHEIGQITGAFEKFHENYKPQFTFIVVKKRINTRFFKPKFNSTQKENVPPGTVMDTGVTNPDWYDFFLVSQNVTQGTVTPTHYHVIEDSSTLSKSQLQALTYKLCHMYYNWSGKVPAPCQYAHKLAFLTANSLQGFNAHLKLSSKLFFL